MENYNAIKWYKKDDEFVVELLIGVSDLDDTQGSSEISYFKTQAEQFAQIRQYLKEGDI